MIDVDQVRKLIAEITAIDEQLADRGPFKVLPRPPSEVPNVVELRGRLEALQARLRVQRNYDSKKGHDVPGPASGVDYDLGAVGVIDDIKAIKAGEDRANPDSTTLVRVDFPSGHHLWFDPSDLEMVP